VDWEAIGAVGEVLSALGVTITLGDLQNQNDIDGPNPDGCAPWDIEYSH
jgi:hypothetical protein